MSEENKKLVRRWFEEVWNQQSEEAIDEMFAPGGKAYGFPEPNSVLVGPENFKSIHRIFLGAFPDLRITVREIVSEGDRVAVAWTATMTHLGEHLGFAPTMKQETLEGSSFLTVSGSQIKEGTNYMDMQALILRLKDSTPFVVAENETSLA
ncbi:MAG TPA: ester cyclase [Terracidiphilus sp.]|nr:ester cyclase [Terracidiphilus sp.]